MCDRLWGRAWSKAFQRQTVAITLVVLGPAHQIASVGASVSWLCLQMRPSGMWSKGLVDSTQQELKDTKENKQQSGLTRECKRPKKCIPNKCFCARKRDRWKRPFSSLWLRRRPPPQRHRRMLCPCLQREWKSCSCNRSAVSIELWKQPKMAACSTVILVVNLFLTWRRKGWNMRPRTSNALQLCPVARKRSKTSVLCSNGTSDPWAQERSGATQTCRDPCYLWCMCQTLVMSISNVSISLK